MTDDEVDALILATAGREWSPDYVIDEYDRAIFRAGVDYAADIARRTPVADALQAAGRDVVVGELRRAAGK